MSNSSGSRRLPHLSMARVKRLVSRGDVAATLLAIWTIYWPVPYYPLIACCFAIPVLAICLDVWLGGALNWKSRKGVRDRLSLATMTLMPTAALAGRALGDFNFLNWQMRVVWWLLVAACISGSAYFLEPQVRSDRRQFLSVILFALVAGYSIVAFADRLLDPFSASSIAATVSDKYIRESGGPKGGSIFYNVRVTPSPPGWTWIHVRSDVYRQLHIGQRGCLVQGTGLLGIGWLDVRPCNNN